MFVAKIIIGSVTVAAVGIALSFFFDIPGLLAVSGFLLFFAGVVALSARDKLRRNAGVGESDGKACLESFQDLIEIAKHLEH